MFECTTLWHLSHFYTFSASYWRSDAQLSSELRCTAPAINKFKQNASTSFFHTKKSWMIGMRVFAINYFFATHLIIMTSDSDFFSICSALNPKKLEIYTNFLRQNIIRAFIRTTAIETNLDIVSAMLASYVIWTWGIGGVEFILRCGFSGDISTKFVYNSSFTDRKMTSTSPTRLNS